MSANHRVLIHACYKILLAEDGVAISEVLDVEDHF